jgi:hypothetical protein
MISPICIYTNEIDSYFKALQRRHHGAAPKSGVRIVGTWVNRPQNEFILKQDLQRQGGARSVKYPLNNWNGAMRGNDWND